MQSSQTSDNSGGEERINGYPSTVGNSSISMGVSAVPQPSTTSIKGPKIVKADAAVVSFMPASLRVKRQKQQNGTSTANLPMSKKVRVETPTVPTVGKVDTMGNVSNAPSVQPATSKTSVDDAYANFMAEINELG